MSEPPLRMLFDRINQALDLREAKRFVKRAKKFSRYSGAQVDLGLRDGKHLLCLSFTEFNGRIRAGIYLEDERGIQYMLPSIDFISVSQRADLLKLNNALDGALPAFLVEGIRSFLGVNEYRENPPTVDLLEEV